MKIEINCQILNTKNAALEELCRHYDEMYSPNYDAFIDAATACNEEVLLVLKNANFLDDLQNFEEVLQIVRNENKLFDFVIVR